MMEERDVYIVYCILYIVCCILYILKCLYLKNLLFNINAHYAHLFAETPTLLQKFVTLCRTVSVNVAYFMTKVIHTALYFSYQSMERARPRMD
jgi:hypothetical protein